MCEFDRADVVRATGRDGQRLALIGGRPVELFHDDTVRLWDARCGKQLYRWNGPVETAVLAPDGRVMLTGDRRLKTADRVASVYTPLELAGRDIYVREGCYTCHSQMIRTLVPDVMRYGDYSRLGESIWDHPYQWGSKRNGPDLARVGGK